jgi:undecaprenyl phosphate-alpha-L-ara4N flippase subunit ArnF
MSQIAIGFLFSFFTAAVVLVGDVFIKQAADAGHTAVSKLVLVGVVLYAASALLWFVSVRHIPLATAGVAFSMASLVALALIGAFYFKEPFGLRDIAGIGCALVAMVLMMHHA